MLPNRNHVKVEREMVELALHDELNEPYAEVLENQTTRIHLGLNHKSDDLHQLDLENHKLQKAVNLLSNDNQLRDFIRTENFVLIREAI